MKKREKYKIVSMAIEHYNETFQSHFKNADVSEKQIKKWLKEYPHSYMVECCYCCYGLYKSCWQELYEEGNWGETQEQVNKIILDTFHKIKKKARKDHRIAKFEKDGEIYLAIVARDLNVKSDFLIGFRKEDEK